MFNSLSQTISPRATPFVTLKKVWKVLADESYDVLKTSRYAETLVALRTVEKQFAAPFPLFTGRTLQNSGKTLEFLLV